MLRSLLNRTGWRPLRSIKERREEYKLKKQQEQFKASIKEMSEKEEFTLRDYKRQLIDSIKSQSSGLTKLFSGTTKEESDMVESRKVLNALKDEELLNHKLVDATSRKDVAQVTQVPIQKVNQVLSSYKNELKLHAYLRARKLRNEHLPETQQELKMMMMVDRPPPTYEEKFSTHQKTSNKQRRMWQYKH